MCAFTRANTLRAVPGQLHSPSEISTSLQHSEQSWLQTGGSRDDLAKQELLITLFIFCMLPVTAQRAILLVQHPLCSPMKPSWVLSRAGCCSELRALHPQYPGRTRLSSGDTNCINWVCSTDLRSQTGICNVSHFITAILQPVWLNALIKYVQQTLSNSPAFRTTSKIR